MKKFTSYQVQFIIGFISGSCAIVPLLILRADASLIDAISNWSAAQYGIKPSEAQEEPLPVPQSSPPVGRSDGSSIAPCAAPPPTMSSVPSVPPPTVAAVPIEESRPSLEQFHPPRDEEPAQKPSPTPYASVAPVQQGYKDYRTKILMGIAPGNKMRSLISRVDYPDRFDSEFDYYETGDGVIAVKSDRESDRVVSIQFVR